MGRGYLQAVLILTAISSLAFLARGAELPAKPTDAAGGQTPVLSGSAGKSHHCPPLTRIRFYPRKGFAKRMLKGRFTGSNESRTNDFSTLAEIKDLPAEGQWTEIQLPKPVRYRYIKYESPNGGWGNVAEVEFYSDQVKIPGEVFGTTGSRDDKGNDFSKAMDGNVDTYFDGVEQNNQYVGIDLGPEVQAAAPTFSPAPGAFAASQEITIASATPGVEIRYDRDWGRPGPGEGQKYKGPIKLEKGAVLIAVAFSDRLAPSPLVIAPYRIGQAAHDEKTVRTFHIGNSLTDTVDGWLKPVAESAGRHLEFHRFTIPGAPTDWLWNHPGGGFGDNRFPEAFFVLAPIDHIFTQPFHAHDRSIANEVEYSTKFFELCRKNSPNVQAWLYVQWPGPKFQDRWSQAKGSTAALNLRPAQTFQEGVANHVAYTEAVAEQINKTYQGKPVRIVPGGVALALLKTEIDAGRVPGMSDFVAEMFADGIHQTPKGRYLISLVHYACIYGENPEGRVSVLTTGLTAEQTAIFQRVAWDAVKNYKWAGAPAAAKK